MTDAYIFDAIRTPRGKGKPDGSLHEVTSLRLSAQVLDNLRDRSDLYEAGGNVVRLGPRHRFSVNTQALDLTLLPRGETLAIHLTGTDFLETLHDPELDALKPFWQVTLDSESDAIYRGEYLAGCLLLAAEEGLDGLDLAQLQHDAAEPEALVGEEAQRGWCLQGVKRWCSGATGLDAALVTAATADGTATATTIENHAAHASQPSLGLAGEPEIQYVTAYGGVASHDAPGALSQ